MPISPRPLRLLGGLSAAAACLLAGAASANAAASLNVTAQCTYPVGGAQPASFTVTFPDGLQAGDWTSSAVVSNFQSAGAEALGDTVQFARNGGVVGLRLDGASPPISSHGGPFPPTSPIDAPAFLNGTLPDPPAAYGNLVAFPQARTVTAEVTSLHLNLRAQRASGSPVLYWQDGDPDRNPETADVPCELDAGQALTTSFDVAPRTIPLDRTAPSAPGQITVSDLTKTSATINWGAATDDVGVDRYQIMVSERPGDANVPSQQTDGLTATFRSLKQGVTYTVEVEALDRGPNRSPVATATFTTVAPPTDQPFVLGLNGKATLQGRTTGTLPLVGSLEGTVYASDESISAGLTLAPSTAEFHLSGGRRVTATATFSTADASTGSLQNGVFQTRSVVDVKFTNPKLNSSVSLPSGATCGLQTPAALALASGPGFDPAVGGTLTGTATLGRLADCGVFGKLVGPDLGTATVSVVAAPATQ